MSTPPIPPQPGQPSGYEQVILPPAAQQQPAGYPPAPSQVYAQPRPAGSPVVKIILIVVGVFVFFGILGAAVLGFGVYKVSKAVHRAGNGDVSFSTPNGGSISAGSSASISSADLGLPDYPGATRSAGGLSMKTPAGAIVSASFTTSDSRQQVVDFYKQHIGEDPSIIDSDNQTMLTSGQSGNDKKVVTISEHGSVTRINIVHTSHKEE